MEWADGPRDVSGFGSKHELTAVSPDLDLEFESITITSLIWFGELKKPNRTEPTNVPKQVRTSPFMSVIVDLRSRLLLFLRLLYIVVELFIHSVLQLLPLSLFGISSGKMTKP